MEKLQIGPSLTLDLETKSLLRTKDGRKVNLGWSACLCLKGLASSPGEILSHEQLLYLGWQQIHIQVTGSSLRVAINQIRRALLSLQVGDDVQIVNISRAGYRLVINSHSVNSQTKTGIQASSKHILPAGLQDVIEKLPARPHRKALTKILPSLCLITSALLGIGSSWLTGKIFSPAKPLHYRVYDGPELSHPPGTIVFVDTSRTPNTLQLKKALDLWMHYAPEVKDHPYLYVNIGSDTFYYGIFACKKPLGEEHSECSSSVFMVH